jgi:hypothetical protein
MKKKTPWSRNDKLVVVGIAVAVADLASTFFIPEVPFYNAIARTHPQRPLLREGLPAVGK